MGSVSIQPVGTRATYRTLAEAAAILGVTTSNLRLAAGKGTLRARKASAYGGPWIVTDEAISEYARDHLGRQGWKGRKAAGDET